jgi:hypothetical protein
MVELYFHSPMRLYALVLYYLSTGTTLSFLTVTNILFLSIYFISAAVILALGGKLLAL